MYLRFSNEVQCHLLGLLHLFAVGLNVGNNQLKGLLLLQQLLWCHLEGWKILKVLLLLDAPVFQWVLHCVKLHHGIYDGLKTRYPVAKI